MAESAEAAGPASRLDPEAALEALRRQGGERFDPVRFRFLEAMLRRSAEQQGAVRENLNLRLAKALQAFSERLAKAREAADDSPQSPVACGLDGSPLAALLDYIGRLSSPDRMAEEGGAFPGERGEGGGELRSVSCFRNTWSKLSVDRQLAEALEQAPENAGPLNSHHLVLQSLKLMRDVSPDYLKHFMSYVDALFWLEQADLGRRQGQRNTPGGESDKPRKTSRRSAG